MTLDFLNDVNDVEAEIGNYIIIVRVNQWVFKLIKRITDAHLLKLSLPCLPGLALITCIELLGRALQFNKRSRSIAW